MPGPEQILSGLRATANDWWLLAIVWHGYFGIVAAWVCAVRATVRQAGLLLSVPLLSVSVLAWTADNPFNAGVFAALGITAFILATRLLDKSLRLGSACALAAGVVLFAFGWLYPHFLENQPLLAYLYATPLGLIPCPTLSAITGLGLVLGGLGSRAWSMLIGASGVFYGAFGVIVLGVVIDAVLLAGGLVLLGQAVVTGYPTRVDDGAG